MAKFGNRGTSLVVCSGQNVMNHYLKVLDKVGDEVVIRSLCSVFQKLMKVTFKNLYLVVVLQITKLFFLFTKYLYLLCLFSHFI